MKSLLFYITVLSFVCLLFFAPEQTHAQPGVANSPEETKPLLVGQITPNVTLTNLKGEEVKLLDVLKSKPTVLVFFRGGWCPYCNAQLIDLRKTLPAIEGLGFQLVAISPDSFHKSGENLNKNELNFTLLSDPNIEAITSFGLAYKAPSNYTETLKKYSENKNDHVIPIPTVYIVNTEGLIQFQYANTDFKKRISSTMLISVLKAF